MIKDLLAVVETGPANAPTVDAAILLAEQEAAHLGITAVTERLLLTAMFDPLGRCWPDTAREEEHRAGLDAIRKQAAIANIPVDLRGLCDESTVLPSLADLQSRYADLVLVGAADGWSDARLRRHVVEAVLLGAGVPVLAVPSGWAPAPFERIILGWNASQQAARAARELRHIAAPGAAIDVVIIDDAAAIERHSPGDSPGDSIACHLARHGFTAKTCALASEGRPIASVLEDHARDRRAQLLAVGAYAHNRFREAVLGGVTRRIVAAPAVATLLVH